LGTTFDSPLPIDFMDIKLDHLLMIIKLINEEHSEVGNLNKEDSKNLDETVRKLGLDKCRNHYLSRSRENDQSNMSLTVTYTGAAVSCHASERTGIENDEISHHDPIR